MYSLMLVDDEYMILRGMKKIIDWSALKIEIIQAEKSPLAAIEYLKNHHVDILISDMNMAELDGAEFLPIVRSIDPKMQIIVLSGYSNFTYAKAGIESNIIDYLEKPVDPDELENIVNKAINKINQRRQKDKLELEHLANRILTGEANLTEPAKIDILMCDKQMDLSEIIEQSLVLGPIDRETSKIYLLKKMPQNLVANNGNIVVYREVPISEIAKYYQLVKTAFLRLKFLEVSSSFVDISQKKAILGQTNYWSELDFRHISNGKFKIYFHEQLEKVKQTNLPILGIKHLMRSLLLKLYEVYQVSSDHMVETIVKVDQANKISIIVEIIESEVETYIYTKRKQYPELIERVLKITRENYSQKLSLNKLSQELNVNNVYLGALFKKHLNKSFAQYLNEFRIARAVELLQDNKLDTNEIALAVGYPTANYFFKVFKAELNMTPKEYRYRFLHDSNS